MRDFARIRRTGRTVQRWVWALAAAAACCLAVFAGHEAGKQSIRKVSPAAARIHDESVLYEASSGSERAFERRFHRGSLYSATGAGRDGPSGARRFVSGSAGQHGSRGRSVMDRELPADVVVGEDGLPRAVRITENSQF